MVGGPEGSSSLRLVRDSPTGLLMPWDLVSFGPLGLRWLTYHTGLPYTYKRMIDFYSLAKTVWGNLTVSTTRLLGVRGKYAAPLGSAYRNSTQGVVV